MKIMESLYYHFSHLMFKLDPRLIDYAFRDLTLISTQKNTGWILLPRNVIRANSALHNDFALRFEDYLARHGNKAVEILKRGMSVQSNAAVDLALNRLKKMPMPDISTPYYIPFDSPDTEARRHEQDDFQKFLNMIPELQQTYKQVIDETASTEFFYHHGLCYVSDAVKQAIRGGVFLDCGGFDGSSAKVMAQYAPSELIVFEPSEPNRSLIRTRLSNYPMPPYRLEKMLLGHENGEVSFDENQNSCSQIDSSGTMPLHPITKLDTYIETQKIQNLRWIKADLEGAAYDMISGARETICKNRPLLTLGVYHCPEEFFEIKKTIENWNLNYHFAMRRLQCHPLVDYNEVTLIAYPEEWDNSL